MVKRSIDFHKSDSLDTRFGVRLDIQSGTGGGAGGSVGRGVVVVDLLSFSKRSDRLKSTGEIADLEEEGVLG